jgi:ubiquinone/menaquinone biosynthesis C-methylase UbiE
VISREVTSDVEMLERLARPAGKDVVDVGCGGGALVRALTTRGARVTGVEVSERQLADAVAHDEGGEARYVIGTAEQLPIEDDSADLVMFMRTLHHVPQPNLVQALREARRVLRPAGLVYVAEPLAEGDFYELVSLVEDELEARQAAQQALAQAPHLGLARQSTIEYEVRVRIADLAALRTRIVSVDPERAAAFDARREELQRAFRMLGTPGRRAEERCFFAPMRVDLLGLVAG